MCVFFRWQNTRTSEIIRCWRRHFSSQCHTAHSLLLKLHRWQVHILNLHWFDFCHNSVSASPCMTAWRQHAVSKSGTLLLSQEGCFLEIRGQDSPCSHCSVRDPSWQHGDSVLSPLMNTVVFECFSWCWLGVRKGIQPVKVKVLPKQFPKVYFLESSLNRSNMENGLVK